MNCTIKKSIKSAIITVALVFTPVAYCQETETGKAITVDGTFALQDGEKITIVTDSSADPVQYTYSKQTKVVDELGNPVSPAVLKAGNALTIHYAMAGDKMVANKIVLKKGPVEAGNTPVPVEGIETTTTVTASGTVSELDPNTIVVQSGTARAPLRYQSTKTTTYVDESGAPVEITTVKAGQPVTVHYSKEGNAMVANKVVVKRTAAVPGETTTATTTIGTVSDLDPRRIIIKTESSAAPIQYTYTKSTTYVDESGAPVSVKTIKSGTPVTVHYTKSGKGFVANKVVVRKTESTTGPGGAAITTTMGTVSRFAPEGIVIQTESSANPVSYTYTKATTYVDETGTPVSIKTIKSGMPVTVYSTTAGDSLVANKVVVRKTDTVTGESTLTVMPGTVTELSPEAIMIKSEKSPKPVRYRFTSTTTYVDEAGKPVSVETVRTGIPVTIHYTDADGALIANKVVVKKAAFAAPPE